MIVIERVASRSALVAFETNRYSVPPGYAGQTLTVRARVGEPHLRIVTRAGSRSPPTAALAGAEQTIRSTEHAVQLERRCWRRSRPRLHAARRSTGRPARGRSASSPGSQARPRPAHVAPVRSLADYAQLAEVAC